MSARRRRSNSASCCTWATSSMRSSGIPKIVRRACTTAAFATSSATSTAKRFATFTSPRRVDDYRAVYRAYLHDPDLQDARARWPFVSMWDNHEFSWLGWQSLQKFDGETRPAQTRKVAANQAFFEFQPARMARPSGDFAGSLQSAAGEGRADHAVRRSRPRDRSRIISPPSTVSRAIARCAGAATSS